MRHFISWISVSIKFCMQYKCAIRSKGSRRFLIDNIPQSFSSNEPSNLPFWFVILSKSFLRLMILWFSELPTSRWCEFAWFKCDILLSTLNEERRNCVKVLCKACQTWLLKSTLWHGFLLLEFAYLPMSITIVSVLKE